MFRRSRIIFMKDIRQVLSTKAEYLQALLLGMLFVFVFSLVRRPAEIFPIQLVAVIFWLISSFSTVLIANILYRLDEHGGIRSALLQIAIPLQSIWLGKCVGIFCLLLGCQIFWLPFFLIFFHVSVLPSFNWQDGMLLIGSVDFGLAVLGGLLGTFCVGSDGRDILLTVLCFPLLLPLLLAAISLSVALLDGSFEENNWWYMIFAFDFLFTSAALLLFPFAYSGE